jgi:hypothetical protein
MSWKNDPLKPYHGTDSLAAGMILRDGVDLRLGKPLTDFGAGFYTTTSLDQAMNWANTRTRHPRAGPNPASVPAVVSFAAARDRLARYYQRSTGKRPESIV